MQYNAFTNACGSFTYGEVEDYSVTFVPDTPQLPVADFSASATAISLGGSVQFSDQSTGVPDAWSWTFEGGTPATSTQQNPSVSYNAVGSYTVTLTATNASGSDLQSKTGYITVTDTPVNYCTASGSDQSWEYISRVQVGAFDNTSGASSYTDFTGLTAALTAGANTNLTLTPTFPQGAAPEFWRVWIDYNGNGNFNDAGERVFSGSGNAAVSGSFNVPATASGTTRMRVSMQYNAYTNACGGFTWGEVEDYSVDIIP